ncbi:DUF998 domain-containing protein [Nocardia cyriacigeorgica]|uniref:DUF998 domain-containing protein n=2 Tax=Nocardia cyriacigeorgica TaxID=135487 RepID=A0A6P1D0U6_9NOCA|nr:DUF998 domain-containing protein [Nocardia cyriacigeorgica]MBF6084739.1 DUF998 domain-containing protein [Nocardia cyriacigeorgica]MBF6428101.1 DUF998 domain-containing protein [Nocardia cyriacigeorgica]NEW36175.1 DUF998 domain-containing protein [Nocardia cyriacigeorgica]
MMNTEKLLSAGVYATPAFFVVALAQAATRDGFDLSRHMISQLALGELGWIQIANFVITGLLFVAAAIGLRRTVTTGIGRVWIPRLVGVFGAGLIAAGVLVCDPVKNYPVGAADTMSWHGIGHGVAAMISGVALVAAEIILARRFAAQGRGAMAVASVAVGVAYLALPYVIPGLTSILFAVASLLAWGWIGLFIRAQVTGSDRAARTSVDTRTRAAALV